MSTPGRSSTIDLWNNQTRVPAERIVELPGDMVEVTLSGPHLATLVLITSLEHSYHVHAAIADRVYRQVSVVIDAIDPDATSPTAIPTIVLDDQLGEVPA